VYGRLRKRILSGELPAGDKLPSQRELGAEYGVSPVTARLAVAELEHEGLVVRRPRHGTFVCTSATPYRAHLPLETSPPSTEAALREAHEHYRALLDGAPFGISLADLEGNLIVTNAAYRKIVGYTEDELRGLRFTDLTHPDDIQPDLSLLEEAIAGARDGYEVEKRYVRKDGAIVWARVRVLVARDAAGIPTYDIAMVEDITEERALARRLTDSARALEHSDARYRGLVEASPDAIFLASDDGTILMANPQAAAMYGCGNPAELVGLNATALVAGEDRRRMQADIKRFATVGGARNLEYRGLRYDGSLFPVEISGTRSPESEIGPKTMVIIARDISDRKTLEEHLRHYALHDDVTGLPNRALLSDRAAEAIQGASRDSRPIAVLLLDLVGFRLINDTFGHAYGDLALEEVGRRLRLLTRATDTIARVAGDQFALLLDGADGPGGRRVADVLCRGLEEPYRIQDHSLYLAARAGIAVFPDHGADIQALLRGADAAVHVAKQRGETIVMYDPAHDRHAAEALVLIADLRRALGAGELLLHFQPKIGLRTRCIGGVEALVRWQHPTRGLVPPSEFIGLAEGSGLIEPLTGWILDAALAQCAAWALVGTPLNVAVNVSAHSLHTTAIVDTISRALERWSIPASLLTLEVTETAFMRNPAVASEVVTRLHRMGIRIAIDDFGTGYSSLAYLSRLPVDEIKIDRSFVSGMTDTANASIARAMVTLGHEMGIDVVAEGVDSDALLDTMLQMGCDSAQGYAIARPLPTDALGAWLQAWQPEPEAAARGTEKRRPRSRRIA
jgi:diguanylate cyclase (GGDEF)-like protein/PAS domain S-box-containing protein